MEAHLLTGWRVHRFSPFDLEGLWLSRFGGEITVGHSPSYFTAPLPPALHPFLPCFFLPSLACESEDGLEPAPVSKPPFIRRRHSYRSVGKTSLSSTERENGWDCYLYSTWQDEKPDRDGVSPIYLIPGLLVCIRGPLLPGMVSVDAKQTANWCGLLCQLLWFVWNKWLYFTTNYRQVLKNTAALRRPGQFFFLFVACF